jgi:hypothetical protein
VLDLRLWHDVGQCVLLIVLQLIAVHLHMLPGSKVMHIILQFACAALTVLSHEVAITMFVCDCAVPFTDSDEIPSCGGFGNFMSLSWVAFFCKFILFGS